MGTNVVIALAVLVVVNYLAAINKALTRMADVVERWERHHYQ